MSSKFETIEGLTERDCAIALITTSLLVEGSVQGDVVANTARANGIADAAIDALRTGIAKLRQEAVAKQPTLNEILARTAKSSCCS